MKTYDFPVTLSCPLHTTYRGTGNTKEEALANALLTGNVVDSWASPNDADEPNFEDFDLEEASDITPPPKKITASLAPGASPASASEIAKILKDCFPKLGN